MANSKKQRVEIPKKLKGQVLFASDRTCCVCRVKGKPTQIHHLDENPANNVFENLAVLCLDCHTQTQIRGGFHNKLDAEQVQLYRDDWLIQVSKTRAANVDRLSSDDAEDQAVDLELATSLAEIYREREEYELLAMHYLSIGNEELRDKYIELAIKQGMDDDGIIFFRSEQGRLDLIPSEVKNRHIKRLKEGKDWFGLGRFYRNFEEYEQAAQATCKGIIEALERGNAFTAAIYLKEMMTEGIVEYLFMDALEKASKQNDLWWQFRSMQELEWIDDAKELLLEHRQEIEESGETSLLEQLAIALGDRQRYIELRKQEARSISARPDNETDQRLY